MVSEIDDPAQAEIFQPRFQAIIRDTPMIGWGFPDGLIDVYTGVLPVDWEL